MGDAIIPSDWQGEYCKFAVCWPNSPQWLAVLRGIITIAASGRFWNETTGTITIAQQVIRETFDYNFRNEVVIMTCGDESLSEIAAAITLLAQNQCCGGAGQPGYRGTASSTGSEPPFSPETQGNPAIDDPPEGFDEWEDFLTYKCAIAHDIINLLETSLERAAIINFGTMSLEAVAVAIEVVVALAVPPLAIAGLAILLMQAGGAIICTTLLSLITEYKQELICSLYNGTSSENSLSSFRSTLAGFVSSDIADPVTGFAVNGVAKYMVGSQESNRLYEEDLTRNWSEQDCSDCEACVLVWTFDEDTMGWVESENVQGGEASGEWEAGYLKSTISASGANNWSVAIWTKSYSGDGVQVNIGDTFSLDGISDQATNLPLFRARIIYADDTHDEATAQIGNGGWATITATATVAKELKEIVMDGQRSLGGGGGSFTSICQFDNATLSLSDPGECPDL